MTTWSVSPRQLEQSFARATQLRAELQRKERAIGRRVQILAKGLAALMEPGAHFHRRGVSLHVFDVDGAAFLAAAYLEPGGDGYRYRYAVLYGGEAARGALRTATLDPGDSDPPGPERRIAPATYADYDDFVERLPAYLADITRDLERRVHRTELAGVQIRQARQLLSGLAERRAREVPS